MKKRSKILVSFCALVVAMISMSLVAFASEPSQKPSKVKGVKQTDASDDNIDVSWNSQLTNGCRYKVEISQDGVNWYEKGDTSSNSQWINDLNMGTTYKVRVMAYTKYWDSDLREYVEVPADQYSDVIAVATTPGDVSGVKQTAATTSSVTLTWNKVAGASGYYVYNGDGTNKKLVANVTTNKATIRNLKATGKYNFYVYAYRTAGNYKAVNDGYGSNCIYNSYVKLIPGKVSAKSIGVDYYWSSIKEMKVSWNNVTRAEGYQIEAYQYNGKKVTFRKSTTSAYAYLEKIAKNRFYKIRVRAYTTINGARKYGAWSSYSYQAHEPDVISAKQIGKKKQVKVRWDSVKGATSYTVYMSTKQKSGYKKVATTKRTYANISKIGKTSLRKNKTYYVYVVANRKVGRTTYKSGSDYCWSFKLTK